jgi:hypothetical protein
MEIRVLLLKGDETNKNYKSFEVTENSRKIKMLGSGVYTPFNHANALPNKGIFDFKIKVIKAASKDVFIGICS